MMSTIIENTALIEISAKSRAKTDAEAYLDKIMTVNIDINPHQINAATFAYETLNKVYQHELLQLNGIILADEVGLGKTIEAGIVIKQYYLEERKNIIVICPASIRKQWMNELKEKFNLESLIFDSSSVKKKASEILAKANTESNQYQYEGLHIIDVFLNDNAQQLNPKIIICSYNYAANVYEHLKERDWDLTIFDEAHKLSNIYQVKTYISERLYKAFWNKKKLLLTATPFQNNLKELYGLVRFVCPYVFGLQSDFVKEYIVYNNPEKLRYILSQFCVRTLRKHVTSQINYTARHTILYEYLPVDVEVGLEKQISFYIHISCYLSSSQRGKKLIEMILLKMLASSPFAVLAFFKRLRGILNLKKENVISFQDAAKVMYDDEIKKLYDEFPELNGMFDEKGNKIEQQHLAVEGSNSLFLGYVEQFTPNDNTESYAEDKYKYEDEAYSEYENIIAQIEFELQKVEDIIEYAEALALDKEDTKSKILLDALNTAKMELDKQNANRKILIFTESKRTQKFLEEYLSSNGYKNKIILFNGDNNNEQASNIYLYWKLKQQEINPNYRKNSMTKSAEIRVALLDFFKEQNNIEIMIATTAAAEGLNLQFCSFVVNYDLPWNPQRIEQRIGRCHRYGQKHDVVIINFLNQANKVDQRVYELLSEKYGLFRSIFGISDEVIGKYSSGDNFEYDVLEIYRACRTEEEIKANFEKLRTEYAYTTKIAKEEAIAKLYECFTNTSKSTSANNIQAICYK